MGTYLSIGNICTPFLYHGYFMYNEDCTKSGMSVNTNILQDEYISGKGAIVSHYFGQQNDHNIDWFPTLVVHENIPAGSNNSPKVYK